MKAASVAFAVAAIAAAGLLAPAHAQERMVPLAVSGEWASMAHHPSMIERPDVCITMNRAYPVITHTHYI
jgi:hypothetical protein